MMVVHFIFPVHETHQSLVSSLLTQHSAVCAAGTLLSVDFTTLSDYLHYLQGAAQCLAASERHAMLYLAAAVSDFYIPITDMVCITDLWVFQRDLVTGNL